MKFRENIGETEKKISKKLKKKILNYAVSRKL